MVTFEQALTADNFHENHKKGGKVYNWRRNGKTKTWKQPVRSAEPWRYGGTAEVLRMVPNEWRERGGSSMTVEPMKASDMFDLPGLLSDAKAAMASPDDYRTGEVDEEGERCDCILDTVHTMYDDAFDMAATFGVCNEETGEALTPDNCDDDSWIVDVCEEVAADVAEQIEVYFHKHGLKGVVVFFSWDENDPGFYHLYLGWWAKP